MAGASGTTNIDGTSANENLIGGSGADILYGAGGDDLLNGGSGADTLDGGSGIDKLLGGSGSDTLTYEVAQNQWISTAGVRIGNEAGVGPGTVIGSTFTGYDNYSGGSGVVQVKGSSTTDLDVLQIEVTAAQMADATFIAALNADLARLNNFIVANTNNNTGQTSGAEFTFTAFNLRFSQIEIIKINDITVTAGNDAPVFGVADDAGGVSERADLSAGENATLLSDTGTIAFVDVDLADGHTVSATLVSATDSVNGAVAARGTLTPVISNTSTGDGIGQVTWTFVVQDSAIDNLAGRSDADAGLQSHRQRRPRRNRRADRHHHHHRHQRYSGDRHCGRRGRGERACRPFGGGERHASLRHRHYRVH